MTWGEVIRTLKAAGYAEVRTGKGSHRLFRHTATGQEIWVHEDATRFEESLSGAGPRGTPTYSEGRIYAYGGKGLPHQAPPAEQHRIAAMIWADAGPAAWVCAG